MVRDIEARERVLGDFGGAGFDAQKTMSSLPMT